MSDVALETDAESAGRHLLDPWDEHNRRTAGNVHPGDWVNPEPRGRYNLVVLGAGTAGLVSAIGAAGLGAKVALVEKHLMGGDCLNVGCVPSKALISASRAAHQVRRWTSAIAVNRFTLRQPPERVFRWERSIRCHRTTAISRVRSGSEKFQS